MEITIKRLPSGYYHIRGKGMCNWAQPAQLPCTEDVLRASAFPEASEEFIREAAKLADGMNDMETENQFDVVELCDNCHKPMGETHRFAWRDQHYCCRVCFDEAKAHRAELPASAA